MSSAFMWYVRRLRTMDSLEILHRLQAQAWMIGHRKGVVPAAIDVASAIPWTIVRPPREEASRVRLMEEADAYLDHRWFFFGLNGIQEESIDWQLDPACGKRIPLKFSPRVDYRNPEAVGSIKNIWEKNRHHHLTILSAAFALSGAERYAAEVADQILGWVETNPFLQGANWISPLESGIRLISWVWCERLLRASTNYEAVFGPQSPVWNSVYQHQMFIARAFARGSSANNHVIGEMAGQYVAATAWPFFPESQQWRETAGAVLEEEIVKQMFPSGVHREQAFGYHLFVTELFLMALYEADRIGWAFSESYKLGLRRMIEVIPALTDQGGNLPGYGDGDDGMAVQLHARSERRDQWLYDFARLLLDADVPVAGGPTLPARLAGFEQVPPNQQSKPIRRRVFDDAGLYVLATGRETPEEIFVLVDAGPQGYLSQAAHGHADALSFVLNVGGRRILVDSGTYCYHQEPEWRNYFRGTLAHNTVTVDGHDQSVPGGTFLWLKRADAKVLEWNPEEQTLLAEHNGYRHLRLGVIHRRKMVLNDHRLDISDELLGAGEHSLEWRFHFSPECTAQLAAGLCRVEWRGGNLSLQLDPRIAWTLVQGADHAGWVSESFGRKRPSICLCGRLNITLPCVATTQIEIGS